MAELINLETFVTAVRAGSFAAAARLLSISPAMVGRRIQALEEEHGARLIERTTGHNASPNWARASSPRPRRCSTPSPNSTS